MPLCRAGSSGLHLHLGRTADWKYYLATKGAIATKEAIQMGRSRMVVSGPAELMHCGFKIGGKKEQFKY